MAIQQKGDGRIPIRYFRGTRIGKKDLQGSKAEKGGGGAKQLRGEESARRENGTPQGGFFWCGVGLRQKKGQGLKRTKSEERTQGAAGPQKRERRRLSPEGGRGKSS